MSLTREEKFHLTIHSRINSVTGEGFCKEKAYGKIRQELKDTISNHTNNHACIIFRESQQDGMIHIDYGYLINNEIKIDSACIEADLASVKGALPTLFSSHDVQSDNVRVLHPCYGEGLYERAYYVLSESDKNAWIKEAKSSFYANVPSQLFMMRPSMTLFANNREASTVSETEIKHAEEMERTNKFKRSL